MTHDVIYSAEIEVENLLTMNYDGLTGVCLNKYSQHSASFRLNRYRNSTALSIYIVKIKDERSTQLKIKWSILKKSKSYAVWREVNFANCVRSKSWRIKVFSLIFTYTQSLITFIHKHSIFLSYIFIIYSVKNRHCQVIVYFTP